MVWRTPWRNVCVAFARGGLSDLSELLLTVTRQCSRSRTGTKQGPSQDVTRRGMARYHGECSRRWGYMWRNSGRRRHCRINEALRSPASRSFSPDCFCAGGPSSRSAAFSPWTCTIAQDHELVERGPFRVVRHPSYTGVLLAFRGLRAFPGELGRAARDLAPDLARPSFTA